MVEQPHNLHFVFDSSSTMKLRGTVLFGNSLNSKLFVVVKSCRQVNRSEITLANFFNWLVYVMEILLI